MAKPFCTVVPLRDGGFAVQSTGAQWGVYDTPEEAQEKADRLNEVTRLPRSDSWHAANNGAGARIWFVMRGQHGPYHEASNGRLIRYGSYEAAKRVAGRLNRQEA